MSDNIAQDILIKLLRDGSVWLTDYRGRDILAVESDPASFIENLSSDEIQLLKELSCR